jgi:hypothetical protein
MNDSDASNIERRVLSMMKDILTRVARDTAAAPGTRHVLSDETIERIRSGLAFISAREMELSGREDDITGDRPGYPGQTSRRDKVKLSVDSITRGGTKKTH